MSNTDKRLSPEQLSEILDLHRKWVRGEPGGVRANLKGANLKGANLKGANLYRASLEGANLSGANLSGANLSGANLSGANLQGANMRYAALADANLEGANLRNADLTGADVRNVYLRGANLCNADLTGADVRNVYLRGANMEGVKGYSPVLDLSECKVGYKKVWNRNQTEQVVIELQFPEGAKLVSTVFGRKCRASEAVVVRCLTPGCEKETEFWSLYDGSFTYKVGENVLPVMAFNDSITEECASGIHFFTTPEEAEGYIF